MSDGFDVRTLAATFHAGTVLAAHRHRWGQLVFAASGVMRVATEEAAWLIPPTRAIWLPAGLGHSLAMRGEVSLRTLYIGETRAAPLPGAPCVLEVVPLLRELILHVLTIGMLDPARPQHDRLAGLLIDLMLAARPADLRLPMPRDPRALRLARSWQDNPADGRELADLAAGTGASLRTLQRLFANETGLTIEAWRQKARLIHAVGQLVSGASVTDAALECGYQSLSAFTAAFSRQFGVSPGRYS